MLIAKLQAQNRFISCSPSLYRSLSLPHFVSLSISLHPPPGSASSLIHHLLQPDDAEMVSIVMLSSLLIKCNLLTSFAIKPGGHFRNEGWMGQMWGDTFMHQVGIMISGLEQSQARYNYQDNWMWEKVKDYFESHYFEFQRTMKLILSFSFFFQCTHCSLRLSPH